MKRYVRKCLIIGFVICSVLLPISLLAGCTQHEHIFGEYQIILSATCDTAGERVHSCSVCGYQESEEIPAGHKWSEFEVTVPAECEKKGERVRSCSACGYDDIEVIPAIGHTWSELQTTPATCEIAGQKIRTCSTCGDNETEEIPAPGHKWSEFEITTPAECEKKGEKTRTCSVCGDDEREEIPVAGHKWSEFEITVPAQCETKGKKTRTCASCGGSDTEEIPVTGHDWSEQEVILKPTCEEEGLRSVKCKSCNATKDEDTMPALGHQKASGFPLIGATCEEEGLSQNTCGVCGKVYREKDPALGHEYSEEFTVDKTPTLYEEGEQSRHCMRRNCTSKTDVQSIPRLISESYFRIYVVRGDNQKYPKLPLVKIANSEGKQVASGYCTADDDGRYMFEKVLPFGTYTVTLADILAGFECGTYTISEKDGSYPYDTPERYPSITIHLYSYLGEGPMTSGNKRHTVLNDFSFTTIDGKKISLSELLKEKRLVWLNFYFNSCYPCQAETPEIIRIANRYQDDIAVVCFNGKDSAEEIRTAAEQTFHFPASFYLVEDRYTGIGLMFGRSGYPMNVFIDSGGFVFESVTGSTYSSSFDSYVKNNIFTTPPKEEVVSLAITELPAILPEKQQIEKGDEREKVL